MADKFTKLILAGILVCLVIIALKPNDKSVITTSSPNVNVDNAQQYIQISDRSVGIIDDGIYTGKRGQLIVFRYDYDLEKYVFDSTLDTPEILSNPKKYGIPTKTK